MLLPNVRELGVALGPTQTQLRTENIPPRKKYRRPHSRAKKCTLVPKEKLNRLSAIR